MYYYYFYFFYFSGDHPPITPVGLALPHELLSVENQRIYELVVRHFLATISPDAIFQSTKAKFVTTMTSLTTTTTTPESFTVRGRREISPGFLQIYRTNSFRSAQQSTRNDHRRVDFDADDNEVEEDEDDDSLSMELPCLEKDQAYRIASVKSRQGFTTPPGMLDDSMI